MTPIEIFAIPWLKNFAVPFIGTLLGIGIKMFSRNDNITKWRKKDDFAVGFEMSIAAIIIFLANTFSLAGRALKATTTLQMVEFTNRFVGSFFIFISLCASLIAISFVVRKFGFNKAVFPEEELTLVIGIILPFLFGFLALVAAGFIAE